MVALIVYFFPAVLSVWICEKLSKQSFCKKTWFYCFSLNTMLINGICFAAKKWLLHTADASLSGFSADMTPNVACNYLIMALPLSIAIAVAEVLISKHARVEIEEQEPSKEATDGNPHTC